uniref:Ras-related protein Rab2BV n=1 Tax=Ascaris suum TaxID=6253 RepID=F1LAC1_ASCSU
MDSIGKAPLKVKVVVVGSTGVGKTSIVMRLDGQGFSSKVSSTLGASFIVSSFLVSGRRIELQIWDTAGQERYMSMVPMYVRNAVAALVVYDVSMKQTFNDLNKWIAELERGSTSPLLLMIVGNKNDLKSARAVSFAEGEAFALQKGALFFETSALSGANIQRAMYALAQRLVELESTSLPSYPLIDEQTMPNREHRSIKCCNI